MASLPSVGASAVFVVNSDGIIIWREQFGQKHAIRSGQLEAQLVRALNGTPLIKVTSVLSSLIGQNGDKPKEEEDEEAMDMELF